MPTDPMPFEHLATTRLKPSDCSPEQFYCDESCYNRSVRCNGHVDCSDGSDEVGCSLPCPQHQCPSGRCYTESERCDRHRHCEDGSDEANCKSPSPSFHVPYSTSFFWLSGRVERGAWRGEEEEEEGGSVDRTLAIAATLKINIIHSVSRIAHCILKHI